MSMSTALKLVTLRCPWCGWILCEVSQVPAYMQITCGNRGCKMRCEIREGEKP